MKLAQVYKQFPKQSDCIRHLERVFWNDKPKCPYCNSFNPAALPKENRYHCNVCKSSFSVTARTLFHKTKIDLQKWFVAISTYMTSKDKTSVRKLAEEIGVTKDTAWLMNNRLKTAYLENKELLEKIINIK